ncbi:uncharacterized protein OCT59_015852 [Rhizophagus irregularis]|uniref:uncharacterized protein n=1 Tax=Rhizophagus irregularis TaxID=588596 RepID=UPI003333EDBA|nr:hypothetical protein OCT59_015852 [Rhizophagus irregularis]
MLTTSIFSPNKHEKNVKESLYATQDLPSLCEKQDIKHERTRGSSANFPARLFLRDTNLNIQSQKDEMINCNLNQHFMLCL